MPNKFAMSNVTTFAAAGTNENLLVSERYVRPPVNCIGRVLAAASVAKNTTLELNVGGVSISPPMLVNSNNRPPLEPDDQLIAMFEAPEGKLIQLRAVVLAACDVFWRVELEEASMVDEAGNIIG